MPETTSRNLVVRPVARDELCRRFMAIPGVGPMTALTLSTEIDDPGASGARATSPPVSA
jgi:transposase